MHKVPEKTPPPLEALVCWVEKSEFVSCSIQFDPDGQLSVTRSDYLTGRTALHFAAVNGHVRCIRLVFADFVLSATLDSLTAQDGDEIIIRNKFEQKHSLYS